MPKKRSRTKGKAGRRGIQKRTQGKKKTRPPGRPFDPLVGGQVSGPFGKSEEKRKGVPRFWGLK